MALLDNFRPVDNPQLRRPTMPNVQRIISGWRFGLRGLWDPGLREPTRPDTQPIERKPFGFRLRPLEGEAPTPRPELPPAPTGAAAIDQSRAKDLLQQFGRIESDRGIWNAHWQEIADRIMAKPRGFTSSITPGGKRTDKIFDATACLALGRFTSAMESVVCPRAERWHSLEPQDPALANDPDVKAWLEALTDLLFRVRYGARSAFASETQECFTDLGGFGTQVMMIDDIRNHRMLYPRPTPVVYMAIPLESHYIEENSLGQVDKNYRVMKMDARQAAQHFGLENLPKRIKEAYEKKAADLWTFIHFTYPTVDYDAAAWDHRAMPYTSCYVCRDEPMIVEEAGYRRNPYAVARAVTSAGEIYGRSPAMTLLPDIKMLNEVRKDILRASHLATRPPLLVADDISALNVTPDAINYGMVDENGRARAMPLHTGADLHVGDETIRDLRTSINDGFYVTLFQILVDNPQMTAYEAALRAQEKGQLLSPIMGRQEQELLAPVIENEIAILWDNGTILRSIGDMPDVLKEAGGSIKVVYRNQLAQFQRAPEATRTLMAMQQLTPLAAIDPTVMDGFDPDGVRDVICEANGVPQKALRKPEDIKKVREGRQQQIDASQAVAAAPQLGAAAKDLAMANATSQQAQPALPLPA